MRSVFVTGAASGMGLCCVRQLLAAGAKVTGFDRNPSPETCAQYRHIRGDLAEVEAVSEAVDAALEHGGAIDAAIIMPRVSPVRLRRFWNRTTQA